MHLHAQVFGRALGRPAAERISRAAASNPSGSITFTTLGGRQVHWEPRHSLFSPLAGFLLACAACAGILALLVCCIVTPLALLGLYCGAWIVWFSHLTSQCDQPLEPWLGLYLFYTAGMACFKPLMLRKLCGWSARTGPQPPPLRVQVLNGMAPVVPFFWALLGCALVRGSRTCADSSPWLFSFVGWFSWIDAILHGLHATWFCLSIIGAQVLLWMARRGPLHSLLNWLARHGLLQNMNAARPNIIEEMEVVTFQESLFADPLDPDDERPQGECCICLERYDASKPIRKTPCGHFMHHECLGIWLQVSSTCPACRSDLDSFPRGIDV